MVLPNTSSAPALGSFPLFLNFYGKITCCVRSWNEPIQTSATEGCNRGSIVPNDRGDSLARHLLCPCKQREGLQKEQPCSGRTGQTAAASPAAVEEIKHKHRAVSQSAVMSRVDEAGGIFGREQTKKKIKKIKHYVKKTDEKKNATGCFSLTRSSVALWDTVGTHSSMRRTAPDLTSSRVNH